MKDAKDLFSKQACEYAAFRPSYPDELYQFLFSHTENFDAAWDCATGNGQVANRLAERFKKVYATDLSPQQIEHAIEKDNIIYSIQRAEQTDFADDSFDLVTVGTALHWFDFDKFYNEVKRVGKTGSIIAAWAYSMFRSTHEVEAIVDWFAYDRLEAYWSPERKYVDERYENIPFPFEEIQAPELTIKLDWNFEHIIGYASSWSSIQNYITKHDINPIAELKEKLSEVLPPGKSINVNIPLCLKVGIIR